MSANANDIQAGGASVAVNAVTDDFMGSIDRAEARLKAFGAAALAIGAKIAGFGASLGAGLLGFGKSFSSVGSDLDEVNKKIAKLSAIPGGGQSEELKKLREEAARLSKILGGESVAGALKLGQSFQGLKDSVQGIAVKLGGVLGPSLSKVLDYVAAAADTVTAFIGRNRALAPQLTIVATALTAAGVATAALGAAFYAAGPLVKVALIGATIASLAFAAAMGLVNTVVAISSATVRVLSAIVMVGAAGLRFFNVVAIATAVSTAAMSVAMRVFGAVVAASIGLVTALTKVVAIHAAIFALSRAGYKSAAAALQTLVNVKRAYLVVTALAKLATLGLAVALGAMAADALLASNGFGSFITSADKLGTLEKILQGLRQSLGGVYDWLENATKGLTGSMAPYFTEFGQIAGQAFTYFAGIAQRAFDASKKVLGELYSIGKQTFLGISDAIEAGNIQLATQILWAGVKVAWVTGTDFLKATWQKGMIEIEEIFDTVSTTLKTVWDTLITYITGAIDKAATYVRNKWQDMSGQISEFIAVNVLGADEQSVKEEQQAQRDLINKPAAPRENQRNAALADNTEDVKQAERRRARDARRQEAAAESPELKQLNENLAALTQQAKEEKEARAKELQDLGQGGAEQAGKLTKAIDVGQGVSAKAIGSADAASALAKAFNRSNATSDPTVKGLDKVAQQQKDANKVLQQIAKKDPVQITMLKV